MNSNIDEIKSRVDVVDLIQSYVRLQKSGINYKANCPFHSEKTPSFYVSPSRQIWHCFGCGKGGDIFKFLMEIEGHDFPEALRLLAERAGVKLVREDPNLRTERNRLYDICEEAAKIFERNLLLNEEVKNYLKKRGVVEESVRSFRVGFAPQSWDFLWTELTKKGFKKEEIEKAGLGLKSDSGKFHDRFRNRIMFPIEDSNGRVIGFGGRIFNAADQSGLNADGRGTHSQDIERKEAKYINTPNTLIYDKSKALYGFSRAKQEMRVKNQVVLVEGYMDCLMSHQAGVKNAIAVSGTALTPQHLKIIRRLSDTVISSFDVDAAGESATKRSLELASSEGLECRVATIPSGKDPADAVLENPETWCQAVANSKPVVAFYFDKAFSQKDLSAQGKKSAASIVLPWITRLSNEIEKTHWVRELAKALEVSEEAVLKELQKVNLTALASPASVEPSAQENINKTPLRRDLLEERMVALLSVMKDKKEIDFSTGNIVFISHANEQLYRIFSSEIQTMAPELAKQAEIMTFKGEVLSQSLENPLQEFHLCRRELEKECIKAQMIALGSQIKIKEKQGDATDLLITVKNLSQKLKEFS